MRDLGERQSAHVVQEQDGTLLGRQMLQCHDDGEPHVVTEERRRLRARCRSGDVVEGNGVDEVRDRSRPPIAAEVVETDGRRDAEEPPLGVGGLEVVGAFDGARDGLLAEVVRLGPSPRHAIAVRPQALAAPLDGSEHGHGAVG